MTPPSDGHGREERPVPVRVAIDSLKDNPAAFYYIDVDGPRITRTGTGRYDDDRAERIDLAARHILDLERDLDADRTAVWKAVIERADELAPLAPDDREGSA